jgi:hypothetical protein
MSIDSFENLARRIHEQLKGREKSPPTVDTLRELIETLFFASLRTEESEPIRCRIAFINRDDPDPNRPARIVADRWQPVPFKSEIPFSVSNLVKLAKAVDPWAATLAVWTNNGALNIWGAVDQSVHYNAFVFRENNEGPEMPGMFQAVIEGTGEIAVYKRFVLLGALKKQTLVEKQLAVFSRGPVRDRLAPSLNKFVDIVHDDVGEQIFSEREHWGDSLRGQWVSTLCRILIGIQRYKHGGALLISDHGKSDLRRKYAVKYDRLKNALRRYGHRLILETYYSDQISENYTERGREQMPVKLYLDEVVHKNEREDILDEITGCIRFIASLSRVDGLVWLDGNLSVQGFGVEVKVDEDPPKLFQALNASGTKTRQLDVEHFGMRHRSMMRFCHKYPEGIGFVVSQDGDIRAMMKTNGSILLWENVRVLELLNARSRPRSKKKS